VHQVGLLSSSLRNMHGLQNFKLLNPVIHTVIFVLGYSVNFSKYVGESLSGNYILQLEDPREKEPILLYRS
jgi:hypothetical protein